MSTDAARNAHREFWPSVPTRTLSVGGRVAERTTDSDTRWASRRNGESDRMVPTSNSINLDRRLTTSEFVIYPMPGTAGSFQFHEQFVATTLEFLAR